MRVEAIAWFDMPDHGKWHGQSVMPQQELIRCKDCKYWKESRFETGVHICYWGSFTRQEDEFCSWGEKNDGENV